MPRVVWSDGALDELSLIKAYITLFDPRAAERVAQRLIRAGERLCDYPQRGRPAARGARELVTVRPYMLRYAVEGNAVVMLGIRHSARRPEG